MGGNLLHINQSEIVLCPCLCILARSQMSVLAQETTAAIVLFAGKLHALACLSLAWKETVSRVKRTVTDSFLYKELRVLPFNDGRTDRLIRANHRSQRNDLF